jgi:hypothetical protein
MTAAREHLEEGNGMEGMHTQALCCRYLCVGEKEENDNIYPSSS